LDVPPLFLKTLTSKSLRGSNSKFSGEVKGALAITTLRESAGLCNRIFVAGNGALIKMVQFHDLQNMLLQNLPCIIPYLVGDEFSSIWVGNFGSHDLTRK